MKCTPASGMSFRLTGESSQGLELASSLGPSLPSSCSSTAGRRAVQCCRAHSKGLILYHCLRSACDQGPDCKAFSVRRSLLLENPGMIPSRNSGWVLKTRKVCVTWAAATNTVG